MEQSSAAYGGEFDRRLLAEKLASLAEFAAGAGHEMNNPLAVIAGRAQLLARDEADPERRRDLVLIRTQALRVHEMIADLMLFARPPQPRIEPCNIQQRLRDLVAELQPQATQRGISIDLATCEVVRPLDADPVQLLVALRAVCDNALQALDRGGRLQLELRSSETAVRIVIRDDGPGIPPEALPHIFDPFFSGRPAGRGLGLGLSKCWRIVTAHGGSIDVASPANRGAEFVITLPLRGSC